MRSNNRFHLCTALRKGPFCIMYIKYVYQYESKGSYWIYKFLEVTFFSSKIKLDKIAVKLGSFLIAT